MTSHAPDIGDVFRLYGPAFLAAMGGAVSWAQHLVLRALAACRTAVLGGHIKKCNQCGHLDVFYNSCRNRHCPRCRAALGAKWLTARQAELLPVPYFHLVFTIPEELARVALQNKKIVYDILFRATSETLLTIAADPTHLGAKITFLAVLHTWGQTLLHHPHIHCIVPGGGISPDKSRWISCTNTWFLPERVLSPVFRGKFISYLRVAFETQKLSFHGDLAHLADANEFRSLLDVAHAKNWVVYAKPPFGGPEQVLKYLARYTHRVAISSKRLVSIDEGKVTFRYRDYKRKIFNATMTLDATEFIRRFLLHLVPKGFMRIRQYGFLGNRVRKSNLALARELIKESKAVAAAAAASQQATAKPLDQILEERKLCPACKTGQLIPHSEIHRDLAACPFSSVDEVHANTS